MDDVSLGSRVGGRESDFLSSVAIIACHPVCGEQRAARPHFARPAPPLLLRSDRLPIWIEGCVHCRRSGSATGRLGRAMAARWQRGRANATPRNSSEAERARPAPPIRRGSVAG